MLSELKPRLSSRRQSSRPTLEKTTLISPDAEGTESWASPNSDGLARRHFGTARSFSFGPPGLRFHRQISCLPKELNHRQIFVFVIQDVPHPRSVSKSFPRLWQWQLTETPMSQIKCHGGQRFPWHRRRKEQWSAKTMCRATFSERTEFSSPL